MALNNVFLGARAPHNVLVAECFCDDCRIRRRDRFSRFTIQELFNGFVEHLPTLEHERLMKVHATVLNTVVVGKVYRDKCLLGTGLSQFKSWANREVKARRQFHDWEPLKLKKFCDSVNAAAYVYNHWDKIRSNLMQPELKLLDARRFSLQQFRLAEDMDWCRIQNENLRPKSGKSDDPAYPEDLYQQIIDAVENSGILPATGYDPQIAVLIGKRLQSDIIKMSRHHLP